MAIEWIAAAFAWTGSPMEKFVLVALADHADKGGGSVFPSVALLTRKTGLCERAVRRTLGRLRGSGVIVLVAEARAARAREYRLVLDPCTTCTPAPGAPLPLHDV